MQVLSGKSHTCRYLQSTRVIYPRSSFVSKFDFQQFRQLRAKSLRAIRGGGFVPATAKKQLRRKADVVELDENFDDGDVSYEYEDDEGGGEDEVDDDEEEVVSFNENEMKKWLERKPKGFGEGKVYDTSIEDKLFEEMQQSKQVQAANLKKLKTNPVNTASKTNAPKKTDEKVVPVRNRVRLVNLPKKKNIDRDLKSALQGIPGITNIVPAVTGNKKTRDPICKGFAFVDFKHEQDAIRFVELYTGQTITFGKIQKQIKCELVNAQSSSSSLRLSKNLNNALPLLASFEEDSNKDSNMDDSALASWDETDLDDSDEQQESDGENEEFSTALKVDSDYCIEMSNDSEIDSLPSEQVDRNPSAEKKLPVKVKQKHAPNKKPTSKKNVTKVLDVPGSAKRLKIREKAVLNDVFSKYGSKSSIASKDS